MKGLLRKSAQYSVKCDADVLLLVRIRKNRQMHAFSSSTTEQWLPTPSILVCQSNSLIASYLPYQDRYYPPPIRKTLEDIIPELDGYRPSMGEENESTNR